MKVAITETNESIAYTVLDRQGVDDEALQGMFYVLQDGCYHKGIPRERLMFAHDPVQMERNYNAYLEYELHQERRTQEHLDTALTWLATGLKESGVQWWLPGSGALYVRGLAVKPHDLDVMTNKSEIEAVRKMVAPYIVEPFHHVTGWVVKGFGVVDYQHMRIDFAFEPEDWVDDNGPVDFGPYAQAHLETIDWHGHPILVPPVELHIAPNQARDRHERVAMIRKYIAEKR